MQQAAHLAAAPQSPFIVETPRRMTPGAVRALHDASRDGEVSVMLVEPSAGKGKLRAVTDQASKSGFWLRQLSPELASDTAYAGLLFVGRRDASAMTAQLRSRALGSCAATLFAVAGPSRVACVRRRLLNDGEEVFDLAPMGGGSHCHTTKIVRGSDGAAVFRKEAINGGRAKLLEEVRWLSSLGGRARASFPQILRHGDGANAFVEMEFHDLPTLRKLIVEGRVDEVEASRWAVRILSSMFDGLYRETSDVPDGYVERLHLDRIRARINEGVERAPALKPFIQAPELVINGRRLINALPLVERLANDAGAKALLTPRFKCRTHGDLHFDNVLIDRRRDRFILVDPRGVDYDASYDLGKIWHSCNTMYDLFHEGLYSVTSGESSIDYAFTRPDLLQRYDAIRRRVELFVANTEYAQHEPNWLLKLRFAEASHMCSLLTFHLRDDDTEALALAMYARGVELLNDIYQDIQGRLQ